MDNGGSFLQVGAVNVQTISNRGYPVEHWAERCLERIIHVGKEQPAPIRDQALAYQESIRQVLVHYIAQAIKSDRTTLYNLLNQQGERAMADILLTLKGD